MSRPCSSVGEPRFLLHAASAECATIPGEQFRREELDGIQACPAGPCGDFPCSVGAGLDLQKRLLKAEGPSGPINFTGRDRFGVKGGSGVFRVSVRNRSSTATTTPPIRDSAENFDISRVTPTDKCRVEIQGGRNVVVCDSMTLQPGEEFFFDVEGTFPAAGEATNTVTMGGRSDFARDSSVSAC